MSIRKGLLSFCLSALCLAAASAQAEDEAQKASPKVGEELSQVEGVSIVRQPFKLFGEASASASGGGSEFNFRAKGVSLSEVLYSVAPLDRTRISVSAKLPSGRYDASVEAKDQDAALELLMQAFEQAFDVNVVREEREMEVLVLRDIDAADAKEIPKFDGEFASGGFSASGVNIAGTMAYLAETLESVLNEPVVGESKKQGLYKINIKFRFGRKRADLDAWLMEHGLELVKEKRSVEGVFVEAVAQKEE